VVVALALCLLALASCDMSALPGGGAGAKVAPPAMTLSVTRTGPVWSSYPPLNRVSTDTAAVERLYTLALGLPKAMGVMSCPADNGVKYHLTFTDVSAATSQMTLNATGCQILTIGSGDARMATSDFLTLFTQTIGLSTLSTR
jgi:hypothetical protein